MAEQLAGSTRRLAGARRSGPAARAEIGAGDRLGDLKAYRAGGHIAAFRDIGNGAYEPADATELVAHDPAVVDGDQHRTVLAAQNAFDIAHFAGRIHAPPVPSRTSKAGMVGRSPGRSVTGVSIRPIFG
ncbi:MAG: hypothetical protein M3N97_03850 [Pseudomonadota bacterium]|nr:hypothetical protein [Pseudomonadota bacterium]